MSRTLSAISVLLLLSVPVLVAAQDDPPDPDPAPTAVQAACTHTGSDERDIMAGGRDKDIMCALGGNDYVTGDGRADLLKGGDGNDALVGNRGGDHIRGGPGNDRLFGIDQRKGNDVASGGAGEDWCFIDAGDQAQCEHVSVGSTAATVKAAMATLRDMSVLGDEIQATPIEKCDKPHPPPWCNGDD